MHIFLKYTCMCGYLYIQINYTHYTNIYYVNTNFILDAINRCPSLTHTHTHTHTQ